MFEGVSKSIQLIVEPNPEKLSESHEIEISSGSIIIRSVDEVGLMRGLQWLEDTFEKRRAPYVHPGKITRNTKFDLRMLYPYSSVYGDPFTDSEIDILPEGMLERLAMTGINGIWLQSVLYTMVPFPFDPSISAGWEQRIKGLNRLIEKAGKYGIGVYLYMNEPRAMPAEFFKKYPELAGSVNEDYTCMCTSKKEVRDYLCNACERLFNEAPGLAGVLTITMSENLTNCYSRGVNNCPICSKRKPYEVIGEVNRCIEEGVHKASPKAKVICWSWAWKEQNGWKNEDVDKAVECLPSNIRLMCTSESEMEYTIAGVSSKVADYTISLPGPGAKAKLFWQEARKRNIATMAKVQLNNTWECSAVPYIPVMDLIKEHLDNLSREGVSGLMVSWTLGGYPSVNLKFASKYFWEETVNIPSTGTMPLEDKDTASSSDTLSQAYTAFSNAFREFPFHVGVAYYGPQNFGPMNPLLPEKSGYRSTIIGFPYDDLEHWRSIYPEEIFIGQFKKLSDKWDKGVELLEKVPDSPYKDELTLVAKAIGCHFRSTYLQSLYVQHRDSLPPMSDHKAYNDKIAELRDIIRQEQKLAVELWQIIGKDSRIGFEASNHYFYTEKSLKEKVINCQYLLDSVFVPVVTQADIEAALKELGLAEGDIVLVHSSLSSLGYVVNGAQAVIDAFEAVIGKEGTLVFPTLCQKDFERSYETWHLDKPSDVGYLTEYFRKLPGVLRSDQATHSVAARGKYAYELTFEHSVPRGLRYGIFGETPFSEASPWQKFYDKGAKVVFLGVTMRKNTMKHFMEYRVVNETLEKIKDEETHKRLKDKIWHFKDFRNRGDKIWPFHNAEQLQRELDKAGMVRKAICGKAELICVNIKEMVDTGMKWFEEEPETWYTPEVIASASSPSSG
jgi:aminoglycoside N3'-acetyltransferase